MDDREILKMFTKYAYENGKVFLMLSNYEEVKKIRDILLKSGWFKYDFTGISLQLTEIGKENYKNIENNDVNISLI